MISIQKIHLLMIFSTLNPQFFRHKGHTYLLFKQLRLRLMIIFFTNAVILRHLIDDNKINSFV